MTTLAGYQTYRNPHNEVPVCNYSGSIIPVGAVVKYDTTNDIATQLAANPGMSGDAVALCGASPDVPDGVVVEAIPAAVGGVPGTGVMQQWGVVAVANSAAGAIAKGALVATDAAGQVKTDPTGVALLGKALSAGAAQGDVLLVRLNITLH